jgi:UDP-N-acetylglucosamine 2-epimerase
LGSAVLVTREKTERPEAVDAGLAELVGTSRELIVRRVTESLAERSSGNGTEIVNNPYGDGKASKRIVDWMLERWSGQSAPATQ